MMTAELLKWLLHYDPGTGAWTWLRSVNKRQIGMVAGTISAHGYRIITYRGVKYRASRLAWLYMTGEWPSEEMDHDNRDKADDRWANLREVSRSQNALNRSLQANNTSGARGVHWHTEKGKWVVQVKVDGQNVFGGYFDYLDEAIEARDAIAQELHGDFAILNRDSFCQENLYDIR